MSAFDFYTVLLSFVVSIGVAALLTGVARLIQEAERVRPSLSHGAWMLVIFVLEIEFWVKSWSYHSTFSLGPGSFLCPLALAILAFMAASLVTPAVAAEGPIDLADFHRREGYKYIAAVALYYVAAPAQLLVMGDVDVHGRPIPVAATSLIAQAVLAASALAAAVWRRPAVQLPAAALHLALNILYFVQLLS